LLEILIERLQKLVTKGKEMDDAIDQYHEQETGLRQQLNARVSVMDGLKKELVYVNKTVDALREGVREKDVSIERLQTALDGYREEVQSLEKLIEKVESDGKDKESQLQSEINEAQARYQDEVLKHDDTRADNEAKDVLLVELERRLSTALDSITELESQWNTVSKTNAEKDTTITRLQSTITTREKEHGSALAIRDARVTELRREVERVNEALKAAHTTILNLRNNKSALEDQLDSERTRGMLAVEAMRDQLARALETGSGYVRGKGSVAPSERSFSVVPETDEEQEQSSEDPVVRKGRFFDAGLARRRSSNGKKRRRYDSGLGFLEEADDARTGEVVFSKEVEDAVDRAVRS
jgi:chromosome segregation ATPase